MSLATLFIHRNLFHIALLYDWTNKLKLIGLQDYTEKNTLQRDQHYAHPVY